MEELTENAEEPDEGESKHSEQKLGKLQYKVFIGIQFTYIDVHKYISTYSRHECITYNQRVYIFNLWFLCVLCKLFICNKRSKQQQKKENKTKGWCT